ncbi:MAG: InlB B-repeat-containing protein [Prevotellaceae bacterium]|jgi:uncharacterized protein (TIGR02145 family)/uncharacterized repeat protein (TIGR02543 family)|nr:InlB B-repeat-containing protein [Prevotellaceae bacterium]
MKNMNAMKRIKMLLAALCLLMGIGIQTVGAINLSQYVGTYTFYNGNFQYEYTADSVLIVTTLTGFGDLDGDAMYNNGMTPPWEDFFWGVRKIIVGEGITRIGQYTFLMIPYLDTFIMANTVTELGDDAISENENISSLTLSKRLETIGKNALSGAYSLRELELPQSLKTIEDGGLLGLANCRTDVHWQTPLANVHANAFRSKGVNTNDTLYVPVGTRTLYENAPVWKGFAGIVERTETQYYNVAFDAQGGSAVDTLYWVEGGQPIFAKIPDAPTREGFTFGGWYTDRWRYANPWDFEADTVVSDVTLYAKWSKNLTGTVTDVDGNLYKTCIFGNTEWMVENLRVTRYNDSSPIPYDGSGSTSGSGTGQGGLTDLQSYYKYPNGDSASVAAYGLLYSWNVAFATDGDGAKNIAPKTVAPLALCPEGWRVPKRSDWAKLGNASYNGDLLTVANIPDSFSVQYAGNVNTYGVEGFDTTAITRGDAGKVLTTPYARFWTPELMMPGAGWGCKYMYINKADSTTIGQSNYRNTNCVSLRCIRSVEYHSYTVTFDAKGGSAVAPITVEEENPIAAPEAPVKPDSAFAGWYVSESYDTAWNFGASLVVSDTTLYAKWISISTDSTISVGEGEEPLPGVTGVAGEPTSGVSVAIYPNPAGETLHVNGLSGATTLTLYDLSGNVIIPAKSVSTGAAISLAPLPAGMYFVKIGHKTLKLLKK